MPELYLKVYGLPRGFVKMGRGRDDAAGGQGAVSVTAFGGTGVRGV
jgi:hypothetical protein